MVIYIRSLKGIPLRHVKLIKSSPLQKMLLLISNQDLNCMYTINWWCGVW